MCGSMVDIRSAVAEIRRGKKKIERKKKKETTGQKYNGLPYSIGSHNNASWYPVILNMPPKMAIKLICVVCVIIAYFSIYNIMFIYLFEGIEQILQSHRFHWMPLGDWCKVWLSWKCNRGKHLQFGICASYQYLICTVIIHLRFSLCCLVFYNQSMKTHFLWPPCIADADIIFLPCG